MKWLKYSILVLLLFLTWAVRVYHIGVLIPPNGLHQLSQPEARTLEQSKWIPKEKYGVHQLVLVGNPYSRGWFAGKSTHNILFRQENELIPALRKFFSNPVLFRFLETLTIRWFWGIDSYFEPWMREEMYGVSQFAPHEFDNLGTGYTRQVYYHGVHEVGQMMVDQAGEDLGCTVVAYPQSGPRPGPRSDKDKPTWVLGRNFDFEASRTMDVEKIMKWTFPDQGNAFVSVVWAGMVGAVTGINDHGLYISLNAAGSQNYARYGTPTTLVLLKALQFAKSAEEAIQIIQDAKVFITDIFVLLDSETGRLFRIEKSPAKTAVIQLDGPSVVTNHLISPVWNGDKVNDFRRDELTSNIRFQRATQLLAQMKNKEPEKEILNILRDKGVGPDQNPLPLGNHQAIDALIASHSVVYNSKSKVLYVSQGPGLSGEYSGFDLAASFQTRQPVLFGKLPADPQVGDGMFTKIRASIKKLSEIDHLVKKGNCSTAAKELESQFFENYNYFATLGDYKKQCLKDLAGSQIAWRRALQLSPAYPSERKSLEAKINSVRKAL